MFAQDQTRRKAYRTQKQYRADRNDFRHSKATELQLTTRLREIAVNVGHVIRRLYDGTLSSVYALNTTLQHYANLITPWASAVMQTMHKEIAARNSRDWEKASKQMGVEMRRTIASAPVGGTLRELLEYQVGLIRSIPLDAARKVHDMTVEGLSSGVRAEDLVTKILDLAPNITVARARLIARTESARTAALLTEVRAQHIGSTHYTWMAVMDGTTRPSHRELHGHTFRWDSPPVSDPPNHRSNPGCIWNCRCVAVPLIPA